MSQLCVCGKAARVGHICAVTKLREELEAERAAHAETRTSLEMFRLCIDMKQFCSPAERNVLEACAEMFRLCIDMKQFCSPAERKVLDAMGDIELEVLEAIRDKWSCAPLIFNPPCLAELARRGEKP